MARSPLSRNRRFERIAIPVLLLLFVTVAARQLRETVRSNDECRHRVERVHRTHGHERGPRHDRHERRVEREVEREVIVSVSN